MKMITRCPACSTLFKVVPDQLRIAQGWVRCGQCMATFDARDHMMPAEPEGALRDAPWRGDAIGLLGDTLPADLLAGDADADADRSPSALSPENIAVGAPSLRGASSPWSAPLDSEPPAFAVPAFGTRRVAEPRTVAAFTPASEPAAPMSASYFGSPASPALAESDRLAQPSVSPEPSVASEPLAPPPVPVSGRDDLDRRHARLLEALVRLREGADKPKDAEGSSAPSGSSANRDRRRDAGAGREPGRESTRGDEGWAPERGRSETFGRKDRSASRESRDAPDFHEPRESRYSRQPDRARSSESRGKDYDSGPVTRPMIDFVLSEMGQPVSPSPVSAVLARAAEPQTLPPEVPTFVEQARRRAFWASRQMRVAQWGVALLLALLLALQVTVSQRDWLAAQFPGSAPVLTALCRPMQCQIAPWRHLDAVVIDSSSFVRTGPGSFHFTVTLRNGSDAAVAMPALELALTDAQDVPQVRRVLTPADWGAPVQLAARGEASGAALLTLPDAANPQAIGGYRLTAFYP